MIYASRDVILLLTESNLDCFEVLSKIYWLCGDWIVTYRINMRTSGEMSGEMGVNKLIRRGPNIHEK